MTESQIAAFTMYQTTSLEGAKICNAAHLVAKQALAKELKPIQAAMHEASTPGSTLEFAPLTSAMWKVHRRYDIACEKANKAYDAVIREAHEKLLKEREEIQTA